MVWRTYLTSPLMHKDEAKKKDFKALFLINQCVNPSIYERISDVSSVKEAWDTLQKTYAGADQL